MELIVKKNGIKIMDNQIKLDDYIKNPDNYEFLLNESDDIETYNKGKNEAVIIHDCVLPHPYFGKIDKENKKKIVFLAKNPAYEDYKDKQDTYQYLKNHTGHFNEYLEDIKKVNFLKPWYEGENISFINTWNWWNKKVFGNVKINDDYIDDVIFVNLCGYQSKYFDESHYGQFPNEKLMGILSDADFVFVVWGGVKKINAINNQLDKDKHMVLNLNSIENGNEKYIVNINSLETLLNTKNYFDKLEKVKVMKEEKEKYEKMRKIYGDKLNKLNDFFVLNGKNEE